MSALKKKTQKKADKQLREDYLSLDGKVAFPMQEKDSLRPDLLIAFPNEYPNHAAEVVVDTDEFTALCPWTGLPDLGTLTVRYVPKKSCLELKSFKYYLLSFRSVGIVQEHAACRVLDDLVKVCQPKRMQVELDYRLRGGIHTSVSVSYPKKK